MMNNVHGTVNGRDKTEPMNVQVVSGTYFPTLGVRALIGRTLTDDDDRTEGNHPVDRVCRALHFLVRVN
jgi:macrolide transport system ATP-binding/permease protein